MSNDKFPLLHYTTDSHLHPRDSALLEEAEKHMAEIKSLSLPEKHKQVRKLTKIRKELESENQKLEKRVQLIKKEQQIVVDKVVSGFIFEKRIDAAKKEDEKMRTALQIFKQKEEQQRLIKQRRISEMKLQSGVIKQESSAKILAAKKDNYLYASDVKREAMDVRHLARAPVVNFYMSQSHPHDKIKREFQNYSQALNDKKVSDKLELVANEEFNRIITAKRLHSTLKEHQISACTKLMKQREFHRHYFNSIISSEKSISKLY